MTIPKPVKDIANKKIELPAIEAVQPLFLLFSPLVEVLLEELLSLDEEELLLLEESSLLLEELPPKDDEGYVSNNNCLTLLEAFSEKIRYAKSG